MKSIPSSRFASRMARVLSLALSTGLAAAPVQAGPIDDLTPGQWYQIPNSKIRSVVMSPNPPGVDAVEGPGAVVWSWSGGAYDSKRDRLLVWGGGHTAYAGNEIYAFDLNTLAWARVTDPSSIAGHNGGPIYPDGRPASVHSYDQIEYDPVADRMFVFGGSRFSSGSQTKTAFNFNFDTKDWSQVADIPGDDYSAILGLSLTSAYDPVTKLVYVGGAWGIASYNVGANVWKILNVKYGTWELFNGLTAALDYKRRQFLQIGRGYAFLWDISKSAPERVNFISSGAKEIEQCDAPGLDYDPVSDRIVGWCKTSDVYTLNMDTKVWTKLTASGSTTPGNPYAENPENYHGTFGRFRYVPSKNVFVVVTDIDKDVFVYKLSSGTGLNPISSVGSGGAAPTTGAGALDVLMLGMFFAPPLIARARDQR